MGGVTYVVVTEPEWAFDPADVLGALRATYAGQEMHPESERRLRAEGFLDSWVVEVSDGGDHLSISAAAAKMVELVAWVRAHVPAEVALEVFDTDLTFDPRPLPPGITTEQLIADYWPDVPELDARARRRPRTAEEWARPVDPPDRP